MTSWNFMAKVLFLKIFKKVEGSLSVNKKTLQ